MPGQATLQEFEFSSTELCGLSLSLLVAIDRFGRPTSFLWLFPDYPNQVAQWLQQAGQSVTTSLVEEWVHFSQLMWWSVWCWMCFFAIPCLWCKWRGISLSPLWGPRPTIRAILPYLAMFLCVLPALVWVHRDQRFMETYPFFHHSLEHPQLAIVWEISYGLMFLSLEFFFRGLLIRLLYPRWGWGGIWFSTLPYFVIHYTKPLPEMLGSLPAGLILGYASVLSGSIWGGLLVHLGVAFTMDGLQILRLLWG